MSNNISTSATNNATQQESFARRLLSPTVLLGVIASIVFATSWHSNRFSSSTGILSWRALSNIGGGVLGFLAFMLWFVNFYISDELRKCSPLNEHLAVVSEETLSSECIKDLDKVASPQGLTQMWKEEIQDREQTFSVLLTGVTGYVGRAFLFHVLREIAQDDANDQKKRLHHKIYVMARPKARRNLSAADRLQKIREEPMFVQLQAQWDASVITVESGDLQDDYCGMSEETIQLLEDANITHIVHCAADVNFNRPLSDSAAINISPALRLQALARSWTSCKRFVHCSTAFVNPGHGSDEEPMLEALFPLGNYDPQDLYDSMRGDQKLALEAKKEFGFPNNYVFSKCVAEHLVVRNNKNMELKVVRPAVVGPAWVLPEPGWNGDKPSTITALMLLWGTRVVRFAPLTVKPNPLIPVDVVAVTILDAMIAPPPASFPTENPQAVDEAEEAPLSFRNLTWSHKSPKKFIDGIGMAKSCIPVAVLKGHFTPTEAAISFALVDCVARFPRTFHTLHRIFNLGPLYLLQFVCWVAKLSGIKSILDQLPVKKLFKFSDMLTLYAPYLGREYYFESSINVPPSLNVNQYCISLFTATHTFWTKLFPGTIEELHELELLPKGRWDLWWALTLPCSSFTNRLIGYMACRIVRATYGSAEVNFVTMFHAGRTMIKLESTMAQQKHCVVLATTHRSLMDHVFAKYIAFSTVSLGIDAPYVCSGPEFDDPNLSERLGKVMSKYDRHATLAAFLEGSPSRDGRFQQPRTEFLRALENSGGDHDYTLIPLSIDYDRVEDNEIMANATKEKSNLGLAGMFSLYWQVCIGGNARKSLGDVRISFGVPCDLNHSSDLDSVAMHVQREHRRLATVSDYQLAAAENHLKIPSATLCSAVQDLGAIVCANKGLEKQPDSQKQKHAVLESAAENWRSHMQWIHRFVPYLCESHPKWVNWVMVGKLDEMTETSAATMTPEIAEVVKVLCASFDAADSLASRAESSLREKNAAAEITVENILKEMSILDIGKNGLVNSPICEAAASFIATRS